MSNARFQVLPYAKRNKYGFKFMVVDFRHPSGVKGGEFICAFKTVEEANEFLVGIRKRAREA